MRQFSLSGLVLLQSRTGHQKNELGIQQILKLLTVCVFVGESNKESVMSDPSFSYF